jgi:hypothetical protein
MSVFQDLYHSEISFTVSTFWDRGFDVTLGDPVNGIKAQTNCNRWGEVEPWLMAAAIEHYPDSLFAEMYRDGLVAWLTAFPRNRAA